MMVIMFGEKMVGQDEHHTTNRVTVSQIKELTGLSFGSGISQCTVVLL